MSRDKVEKDFKSPFELIRNHPGKIAHDNWSNLSVTYSGIFIVNKRQLLELFALPSNDERLLTELMQNMWEQDVRDTYFSEMLRLLHNYTAASMTLVDHSRRFIKKYSDTDFGKEYDLRRIKVSDSREHHFLKDLRNYMLHVGTPPVGYTIKINQEHNESFSPNLTPSTLLQWTKWSAPARNYINDNLTDLPIIPLINAHGEMIDELYGWIFEQFHKIHGKDIDDVNRLISETIPQNVKDERIKNAQERRKFRQDEK